MRTDIELCSVVPINKLSMYHYGGISICDPFVGQVASSSP